MLQYFLQLWYLWLLVLIVFIYGLFKPIIKGYLGEKVVSIILSRLDKQKYMLINNLMIPYNDRTSQIDHVVVSNYGIFVIETKNYKGWIIGNEHSEYWKQVIYKRKEKLYNPIKQNYGHIKALKRLLSNYPKVRFIPIIVFSINAELKVKISTHVIYSINVKLKM